MTGEKMSKVLTTLVSHRIPLRSVHIYTSAGSEITISMPQPDEVVHKYLLQRGFISNELGEYIYRP